MKINAAGHLKNKMPKNPTMEERVIWHKEHMENCQCRKPSEKLMELIKKAGD